MEFTDFSQVTEYLDSFTYSDRSSAPGLIRNARLERMENLLRHLGNPERSFRSIHLAGSKGKGSTATFISVLLEAAGHKTGLYLSPHLSDYRERFTLAGRFFDDRFLLSTAEELRRKVSSFSNPAELGPEKPSTFELYTAYAYMLFEKSGCEYAVVETGLGGRLDATNTLSSIASVITPIELEHTAVLGNTLSLIAGEKSRIIKDGQDVFSANQADEALEVIRNEAVNRKCTLHCFADMVTAFTTETSMCGEHLKFTSAGGRDFDLKLSVYGRKQAENAALAILIAEHMGFLTEAGLSAVEKTVLPGRFQIMSVNGKALVLDVAHTVNSLTDTVRTFRTLWPQGGTCIFASVSGKDIEHMSHIISASFEKVIITRPGTYKKSDITGIYRLMSSDMCDNDIYMIDDNRKAIEKTLSFPGPFLITGSFYLAGELLPLLKEDIWH
ncbi:MAG: bifunctional folylpolyglutamate synthase/dihydrofolate synthase [Bullifex sp.]